VIGNGIRILIGYYEQKNRWFGTIEDDTRDAGVCVGGVEDRATRAADLNSWEEGEEKMSVLKNKRKILHLTINILKKCATLQRIPPHVIKAPVVRLKFLNSSISTVIIVS